MKTLIVALLLGSTLLFSACDNNSKTNSEDTESNSQKSPLLEKIDALSKKIESNPDNASLYFERGKLYIQKEKVLLATNDFKKATELDKDNIEYHKTLAETYFLVSNTEAAINTYNKITQIEPENEIGFLELGRIYLYQAKPVECIQNLNEALRRNKYNPETYALKASYYVQMNDTDRAISNLVTSVDVDPDYFKSYLDLGYLLSKKSNPDAIVYYTNALRIEPQNRKALFGRASAYIKTDSFSKAIIDFQTILEIFPEDKSANYNLGYVNFLLGNFENAIQFFGTVTAIDPQNKLAYYGLATSYDSLGNYQMAKQNYLKVLALDANDIEAQQGLDKLK